MSTMVHVDCDTPDLQHHREGDNSRNLRKRKLIMAPKPDKKSNSSLEEMIIEWGFRDGSMNWMVVVAMSSWRSGYYSDVLIHYFGEKAPMGDDDVGKTKAIHTDGWTMSRGAQPRNRLLLAQQNNQLRGRSGSGSTKTTPFTHD
jgi:hypothetical protein